MSSALTDLLPHPIVQAPMAGGVSVPQLAAAVEVYAHQLAGEASWYETELGDPDSGFDDNYEAKLNVLRDAPVKVVSFHFGCPTQEVLESLARKGTRTLVTA